MAISSARNMFCRPGSRSASLIFFFLDIYIISGFFSPPNVSHFFGGIKGSICVEAIFGGEFEWCFFFIVGDLWNCIV